MADQYAANKAHVFARIEEAKRSAEPLTQLREMERNVMATWGDAVGALATGLERVNGGRASFGLDREPVEADALYFPNWMVAEIRKAIAEVQS